MSQSQKAQGGCQCGRIRYQLNGPLVRSHVCHCRMCQRATGGLFAALVGVKKNEIEWITQEPEYFSSSNKASRAFCNSCGTPLSFSYNKPDANFYVTIGSLDDPEIAPVEHQYGVEAKLKFVEFCENLPQEKTGEGHEEFYSSLASNQSGS